MKQIDREYITIIIPVYNCGKLIPACIDSIRFQTVSNWRLIIVDDGSTDDTGEIVDRYMDKDNRIEVFHQENAGPGAARNKGVEKCQTRWLTFVDADDILESDYLQNFHVEELEDDSCLSVQGYKRVDIKGRFLGEQYNLPTKIYSGSLFMERAFKECGLFMYGQSIGKLYNKNIIEVNNLRIATDFNLSEDHLFFLQYLSYVNSIRTHSGVKYLYQMIEGQISLSIKKAPWEEALKRYTALRQASVDIIDKFCIMDKDVLSQINYFSITGGISHILHSLYHSNCEKEKRKELITKLSLDVKKEQACFVSNSLRGKFLKLCLLLFPPSVQDTFYSKVFK